MSNFYYIVCPMCARNRITKSRKKGNVKFDYVDLMSTPILQVRQQHPRLEGGTCRGFTSVPELSLTVEGMMGDPEHQVLLGDMKAQLLDIVNKGIRLGWIKSSEIGV